MELNTAVKPFAFSKFFRESGYERVIYLDPDITVYRPMVELLGLLERHSVILTPHLTEFLPDDNCSPDNLRILQTGTNNLGFLALRQGEQALCLVDWWCKQLYDQCRVALADGVFVDQKWMDLALPCIESATLLRHPGYNVAYWNLPHRRITRDEHGAYWVNGKPLTFFHFSGFNPASPKVVSKHQTRLGWGDIGKPAQSLFREYGERLLDNGYRETNSWPYAYAQFDDGRKIPDCFRSYFQKHGGKAALFVVPPSGGIGVEKPPTISTWCPGGTTNGHTRPRTVFDYFQSPVNGGPLTAAAMALYEFHPDLQAAFPQVPGKDAISYAYWFTGVGGGDTRLEAIFLEPVRRSLAQVVATAAAPPSALGLARRIVGRATAKVMRRLRTHRGALQLFPKGLRTKIRSLMEKVAQPAPLPQATAPPDVAKNAPPLEPGINVFGLLERSTGVGEAARGVLACLEGLSWPLRKIAFEERHLFFGLPLPSTARPDPKLAVNYCHVNADCTEPFQRLFGAEAFAGRFNIGFWAWELDAFPKAWDSALGFYHEIWVPSTFVQQAVAARARVPVLRVPHCVRMEEIARRERTAWGLPPDRPVILCMFDTASYVERKNPWAAIEAVKLRRDRFLRPLAPDQGQPGRAAAGAGRAIETRDQSPRLPHCHGAAEPGGNPGADRDLRHGRLAAPQRGFRPGPGRGHGAGQARRGHRLLRKHGLHDGAKLVPRGFPIGDVEARRGALFRRARWAEPDVEHAACLIRELLDDPERARRIGHRAAADMAANYSVPAVAQHIARRLESLGFAMPAAPLRHVLPRLANPTTRPIELQRKAA